MKTITVQIGSVVSGNNTTNDNRRDVEFVGEALAVRTEYGTASNRVTPSDSRGVTETLYRTEAGKLIVHTDDWSRWQGEPNTESLQEVTEADLSANGDYAALGARAGMGRPLTLDEALTE